MQKALLLSFQPSVTKVIPVTENASNIIASMFYIYIYIFPLYRESKKTIFCKI